MHILVGTEDGLVDVDGDAASTDTVPGFDGRTVVALGAEYPRAWAVVDGSEIWRGGGSDAWTRLAMVDGVRANCIADTRAGYLVGTSDARLFRVHVGG